MLDSFLILVAERASKRIWQNPVWPIYPLSKWGKCNEYFILQLSKIVSWVHYLNNTLETFYNYLLEREFPPMSSCSAFLVGTSLGATWWFLLPNAPQLLLAWTGEDIGDWTWGYAVWGTISRLLLLWQSKGIRSMWVGSCLEKIMDEWAYI
jgi:hypothetical protein